MVRVTEYPSFDKCLSLRHTTINLVID